MGRSIAFWPALAGAALVTLTATLPAWGQPPRTERVSFAPGTSGATLQGRIQGYEGLDYLLGASAGQRMRVVLDTSNPSNYFNVLPPGSQEAIFVGPSSGDRFEGELPVDGDYTIRVFLMRNAARRNEIASYTLEVGIFGDGGTRLPAPANDYADGLGGGPDFWEVYRVAGGDALNLRQGPSTGNPVIGSFVNGDILRNLGCTMAGDQRWCKVTPARGGAEGWVAVHYLREAAGPSSEVTVADSPLEGNGQLFHATGEIPCAVMAGQPTASCPFGVIREGSGNAGVWIGMQDRGERYILFESGSPVYTDAPAGDLTFERSLDLYLIRIGDGEERYEIPEAVVFGG